MILILIFAEALALYGLIVGIILSSRAGQSRADQDVDSRISSRSQAAVLVNLFLTGLVQQWSLPTESSPCCLQTDWRLVISSYHQTCELSKILKLKLDWNMDILFVCYLRFSQICRVFYCQFLNPVFLVSVRLFFVLSAFSVCRRLPGL